MRGAQNFNQIHHWISRLWKQSNEFFWFNHWIHYLHLTFIWPTWGHNDRFMYIQFCLLCQQCSFIFVMSLYLLSSNNCIISSAIWLSQLFLTTSLLKYLRAVSVVNFLLFWMFDRVLCKFIESGKRKYCKFGASDENFIRKVKQALYFW